MEHSYTQKGERKKKYRLSRNTLLAKEVKAEWPDWFKWAEGLQQLINTMLYICDVQKIIF